MNCRDVRDLADSFLGEELVTETNHEILWHLDTCPSCRTEMDARRRLRAALRGAFNYAPELQPVGDFADRLRDQLRQAPGQRHRSRMFSGRWLALAAGVVLAAGVISGIFINSSPVAEDTLARDAIGDHRNCALKYRLVRMPMSLEEAAQQFDSAYRVLLTAPPDDVSTPNGPVHVVERHSCAFGTRRFGHVILQYRGRVVSLLMTANGGATGPAASADAVPHVIGRPLDGLSTVSLNGSRHAIVLVSDLGNAELTQLARTVSSPLVQRLEGVVHNPGRETAFMAARPLDALALPFVLTWNGSRE
jgi:anti-sigma factor RsiW